MKKPYLFVLMPFDNEFDSVYKSLIKETFESEGFEVFRADDLIAQRNILNNIISSIISADLILADLTGANPNVFYELGLAHGFDKPVILLTQDIADIPFDLQSYRVIPYSTHFEKIEEIKKELSSLARDILKGKVPFGSPVSDFKESSDTLIPSIDIQSNEALTGKENDSIDDRGIFDHVLDVENCFTELTDVMNGITSATESISDDTNKVTKKMQNLKKQPSQDYVSNMRKVTILYADKLVKYARFLSESNGKYNENFIIIENSMEAIIAFHGEIDESNRAELEGLLESLLIMEDSIGAFVDSIREMSSALIALPNLEKSFIRAKKLTSEELKKLIDNGELTLASVTRAIKLAQKKLRPPED